MKICIIARRPLVNKEAAEGSLASHAEMLSAVQSSRPLFCTGDCCVEDMDQMDEARVLCSSLLTYHRELLVTRLRSVQCILDNLFACGFFCQEDIEIVQQTATKPDQVGKVIHFKSAQKPRLTCVGVRYERSHSSLTVTPTHTHRASV